MATCAHTLYVYYDLETTGRSTKSDRIVQLAAMLVYNNKCMGDFTEYVCPDGGERVPRKMSKGASLVTGITDGKLQSRPSFAFIWTRKFLPLLLDVVLGIDEVKRVCFVGYNNWRFDDVLLARELRRIGRDLNNDTHCEVVSWDVMKSAASLKLHTPTLTDRKLGTVYSYCIGVTLDGAHDAMVDVRALYEIAKSPRMQRHINLSHIREWALVEPSTRLSNHVIVKLLPLPKPKIMAQKDDNYTSAFQCDNCNAILSVYFVHTCSCAK